MKILTLFFTISFITIYASCAGENVAVPTTHFFQMSKVGITGQQISIDINGDGQNDVILFPNDPNPDIEERRAHAHDSRTMCDVYIRKADLSGYIYNNQSEVEQVLSSAGGTGGIPLDLGRTYIGTISEIQRNGMVTLEVQNPRSAPSKSIIWAYTWEGTYFKQQKLSEFVTGEQNALFDKYLADGKRTVLQVQQVAP